MYNKIFLATFSIWEKGKRTSINGMVEPMLSYFLPKTSTVDLIDGFHPGSSNVISIIEQHKNGKLMHTTKSFISLILSPLLRLQNNNATQILFKIRDFFSVLEWGIRAKTRYDLFIGLESIYALAGILLKKIGIVKTVVYYVSDYSPNRYPQVWFNNIYLILDRFCVRNADYIWDVSPAIHPARIKAGLNFKQAAPVILVPNALFPDQITHISEKEIKQNSLVYAGTLTYSNGPDLAIEAVAILLKKFPKASLHIFGSNGKDQARIKTLIQKYCMEKSVVFHGFITQVADITNAIKTYAIGLAPYINTVGSHRKYGDATKLRLYMGAGIPIVTTNVPPLGKIISKFGAGVVTKDNPKSLAEVIIDLFSNEKKYLSMRKKAIKYAKSNTWENTYTMAISKMKI